MANYTITDETRQPVKQLLTMKGDARTVTVNCAPWSDDNSAVTTATWSVESGQATISSESLASNVATAIITTATEGTSMLKLKITDGTNTKSIYIRSVCKDPKAEPISDYWQ